MCTIEAFRFNRHQAVEVDEKKSSFQAVDSGVPQGTVLGPELFILYVVDMILTFAEDTKLYCIKYLQ